MKRPGLYETTYAHDRRKHRHRCQCCRRIINAGEAVVMYAVSGATRALHLSCAERPTWEGGPTQREMAQLHSDEHARRLGFHVPDRKQVQLTTEHPHVSKFRPKQATQLLCSTARSRRYGVHGWQVYDSATNEVLGAGQSAESAWRLAYATLSMRVAVGSADCKRCAWLDEVHDERCPEHPDYDPTPYCIPCGARTADQCTCLPIAHNN
jgi:hypothetical protein